tara:strand:- start:2336 stop:2674 length:339 start_codon:yes stop_codon:yes gene_type:complete
MEKSNTIYLGSGKTATGQYGEFFNITLNLNKINENAKVVEEFKGTKFVRLRVSKKSQTDQYGKNVMVTWNDTSGYKEKMEQNQQTNSSVIPGNNSGGVEQNIQSQQSNDLPF